jgi:hypothetical protein
MILQIKTESTTNTKNPTYKQNRYENQKWIIGYANVKKLLLSPMVLEIQKFSNATWMPLLWVSTNGAGIQIQYISLVQLALTN